VRAPSTATAPRARIVGVDGFQEGQNIWVEQADGTQRAAVYVGEAGLSSWFGGGPGVYVVYQDTRSGEEVPAVRVVPREDEPAS
jgi:hypothetical protein